MSILSDLTDDDTNGALANVGSDYRVPAAAPATQQPAAPATQQPAIGQPAAQQAGGGAQQALGKAQQYIGATQGWTPEEGEKNGLGRVLGIIGKIYGFGA